MRRGQRNKWTYDSAPQGEGLVAVTQDGIVTRYQSVEALVERHKVPQDSKANKALAKLKEFGWV